MVARIALQGVKPIPIYFREWRDYRQWSQQDIADRLGTTKQTVSRIERGVMDWGKHYLEAFSFVCECPNPLDPVARTPDLTIQFTLNYDEALAKIESAQIADAAINERVRFLCNLLRTQLENAKILVEAKAGEQQ